MTELAVDLVAPWARYPLAHEGRLRGSFGESPRLARCVVWSSRSPIRCSQSIPLRRQSICLAFLPVPSGGSRHRIARTKCLKWNTSSRLTKNCPRHQCSEIVVDWKRCWAGCSLEHTMEGEKRCCRVVEQTVTGSKRSEWRRARMEYACDGRDALTGRNGRRLQRCKHSAWEAA